MPPIVVRSALLISLCWLSAIGLSAADAFIGNWKLNLEKSKITGQTIRIEELPDHSYKFQEDEHTDVIFADGLNHPTHFGENMAITKKTDRLWAIRYKRIGRVLMDATWEVSQDGGTLTYTADGTRPNGQPFTNRLIAKRTSGGTGLPGTWQTTSFDLSSPREIHISPWGKDGETILFPGRLETIRMRFDGKEYRGNGPTVISGATSSGHRIDDRNIETTERVAGKIVETARTTVSADGNTQTLTITEPGEPVPVVLVYEREQPQ